MMNIITVSIERLFPNAINVGEKYTQSSTMITSHSIPDTGSSYMGIA
jgi:hypothetical protein